MKGFPTIVLALILIGYSLSSSQQPGNTDLADLGNSARTFVGLLAGKDFPAVEKYFDDTMKIRLWQAALSSRKNVLFKSYPKLNHLFIEGSGKSMPAEYNAPGHVAEPVINDIVNWIKESSLAAETKDA